METSGKYSIEGGSSGPEIQVFYVFSHMWIRPFSIIYVVKTVKDWELENGQTVREKRHQERLDGSINVV